MLARKQCLLLVAELRKAITLEDVGVPSPIFLCLWAEHEVYGGLDWCGHPQVRA